MTPSLNLAIGSRLPDWAIERLRDINRAVRSYRHSAYPRLLETSIPKSGTHLLREVLVRLGFRFNAHQPFNPHVFLDYAPEAFAEGLQSIKRGEFVTDHLCWNAELESMLVENDFKTVFIYRDPRAVCLSFVNYASRPGHRFANYFSSLKTMRQRIEATLEGIPHSASSVGHGRAPLGEIYDRFIPWKTAKKTFAVRFEDLVGAEGGGDLLKQTKVISYLAQYLSLKIGESRIKDIASGSFNANSATFRKGQISGWRNEVDADSIATMNKRLARQLEAWGYDKD